MEMLQTNAKWLAEMREKSKKDFDSFALPQEREEAWRYTNLRKMGIEFKSSDASSVMIECDNDKAIAVDFATAVQKHPDLMKKYFGQLVQGSDKVSAFHFSNFSDGVFIWVPKNERAAVSVVFETANAHNIIIAEEGATLDYSEQFIGETSATPTDATEIFANENSNVSFSSLQNFGMNTNAFSIKNARAERNASVKWTFLSAGGKFYRLHSSTEFAGEGANAETICASLSRENQHIDITTNACHQVPHTTSNILAKGVLLDSSTAVYRGHIKIDPDAQHTNSYLSDHMLMVGEEALANSIPSLDIQANDVKASHGSTTGQIDEEQLFYLESRGLPREEAEKLIIQGFLLPVLERVTNAEMKKSFAQSIGVELQE